MNEPIAIVGMACRFPGGVTDPDSFWELLAGGVDAIQEIPRDRIDVDRFFDPNPRTPGRMTTRWGGFLGDLEQFDADFFGISPREAATLDPSQRLLMETTWEAFEDATIDPHGVAGQSVGVFVGQWVSDLEGRLFADPDHADFHATTGTGRYASSGRLSFMLDSLGPSVSLDTACSSSLVAVHLACQSLRSGESTLAVAAGVNVILQPHITIAYSQNGMMAPDGRCKFGDADGDGYVRSEGAGVVLLKTLSAARADGDRVRALVRGTAVNNDGRSSGLMARPSRDGQAAMLRTAYSNAGITPHEVSYVEAHGTGTRAGDPVEIGALADVLAVDRPAGSRCLVGSVKTNIGHTEGAAGMAGLLKCVLALEHEQVPGSLHLKTPNPAIRWGELPFDVPQQLVPWTVEGDQPRIAGVSAYGITGTNSHVVVEEPPATAASGPAREDDRGVLPLVLSAASSTALRALAQSYADLLDRPGAPALGDVCATAARHRAVLAQRAVFVTDEPVGFADRLRAFADGDDQSADVLAATAVDAVRRIAFVFPGQGGQWLGMARELLATDAAFAAAIDACDAALPERVDWSVREQLERADHDSGFRLAEIGVIQPVLLAVEIGLAEVWRSLGVEADAVVGHSMGEVGAAYQSGALTLADAMHVICARSELLQETSGRGAMALLDLSVEEVEARIAEFGDRVVVAVSNGPRSTVVSGEPDAVDAVLAACEQEGVFARAVNVDVASHSAQMDPLVPKLVAELAAVEPVAATAHLYSTVDAAARPGELWSAEYWGRNLRQPVMFGATVERMLDDGVDAVIELSPHPTLLPSIAQIAPDRPPLAVGSLRRGEPELLSLLRSLGALWAGGCAVDWARLFPDGGYRRVSLPLYPWQRQRHWSDAAEPLSHDGHPRRRPALDDNVKGWLHVLRWQDAPTPPAVPARSIWTIVGNGHDAAGLRSTLESAGCRVEVYPSVDAVGDVAGGDDRAVILLPAVQPTGFDPVAAVQSLQRAWPPGRREAPPRVWWVTHGAHLLDGDSPTENTVESAAMWGAARVVAVEHPDWWGGIVDLDPSLPVDSQTEDLAGVLLAGDDEDQVALRDGARRVLRLLPAPEALAEPYRWRTDAAYLLTGGLGGIAEHVAMAMVRGGARRLVLVGRTPLPVRSEWSRVPEGTEAARRIAAVRALEHAGASVHLVHVDVSDESQLAAALCAYETEGWPPIAGVIHMAGTLDNHLTGDLDRAAFDRVVLPKLAGAAALERLLPELDLFVAFSSMMSFWPPAGMANYAAANAGLDAVVQARRTRGQQALGIQWGPWQEVGLLARAAERNVEAMEREGVSTFTAEQAVVLFDALLAQNEPLVAVVPIDWSRFRSVHRGRDIALFRSISAADSSGDGAGSGLLQRLDTASSLERRAILKAVVADVFASVLKLSPGQVDPRRPFGTVGLDSLMALELRNRLETELERPLSATLAWNYPTIELLTEHLDEVLAATTTDSPPSVEVVTDEGPTEAAAQIVAGVSLMSDDDLLKALRGGS